MEIFSNIINLIKDQKKNISELEKSVKEIASRNFLEENTVLKNDNEKILKELSDIKQQNMQLSEKNGALKLAMTEQIINEKLGILKISGKKIETYFGKSKETGENNLKFIENELKRNLLKLERKINENISLTKSEMNNELQQLKMKYVNLIDEQKKILEKEYKQQLAANDDKFRKFANEDISEEIMQKRIRQNKLELKIGLNWLNKIAVFLFIMGLGVLVRYSYAKWFNDYMKGSVFFAAGLLFLAGGEFFHRKNKDIFSKGLLGGGIGILYGALFYSYMLLHIINLETALALSIIVTLTASLLSLRYDSETIGIISLIGGYFPFFTYAANFELTESNIYIAAGYIIMLNIFLLLVSVKKQWRILLPVSYVLFMPTLLILALNMKIIYAQIAFTALLFVLYTIIILTYPTLYKIKLRIIDIIILALNIVVNCSVTFAIFRIHDINNADGVIAFIFAVISFLSASLILKLISSEKTASIIFYVTALTFAVLMVPFQFGIKWASMGWLVEGIILAIAGYRNRQKYMEYAGLFIFALCTVTFFLYDFTGYYDNYETEFFPYKFLFITIGSLLISYSYMKDIYVKKISAYELQGKIGLAVKYFTMFELWIFLIIISDYLLRKYEISQNSASSSLFYVIEFYRILFISIFSALLAFIYKNVKIIKDGVMNAASVVLYVFSIVSVAALNFGSNIFSDYFSDSAELKILSFFVLLLINIMSIVIVRDVVLLFIKSSGKSLEIYPPVIVIYFLYQISTVIIRQFDLSYENLIISFSYLTVALFSISYGFIRKYVNVRLLGLGLTIAALAKLFLWDLRTLETAGKILAYFGFGSIILFISFIYQKIKNIVDVPDVKK